MTKRNHQDEDECPFIEVMEVVGGKWRGTIVFCLLAGRRRFTELRRDIPSISQKMLTQELRALERDGLVRREQFQEIPPRVEYSLTELGESMAAIITEIEKWRPKLCEVARARAEYDQR